MKMNFNVFIANFQTKLDEHVKDLENTKVKCENIVKENEVQTLWKIRECEGMCIDTYPSLFRAASKTSQ